MKLRLLTIRLLLLGGLQAHAFASARQRPLFFFLHPHGGGSSGGTEGSGLAHTGDASPSPEPLSPSPEPSSPRPLPPESPLPPPSPHDPGDETDGMFVWLVLLACFLVAIAGLMSGLTLGLMSLDEVDIEILRRSGTERQKRLAQAIQPVLQRPHVLLVTLLVCNAVAAEALPLVLDRLADPATAIIVSVTVVLLFGEIIPQAACSRYGLEIGATSAPFVRLLMWLTAPVSFPIGWVLDRVLGDRQTALFRRAELKALMDIHKEGQAFGGQLSADEVSIIKGALDMTHKTARHAMTPIDMVFMLPSDAVLNEQTLTAIMASGHSRIPVHRPGDRSAILGIMLVKELIMVDKDQGRSVGQQKVRSLPAVRADTPLYDMLKLFEIGRSHMAVLMQLKKSAAERQRKEREERMMVRVDSMSDDPSEGEGSEWEEEDGCLSPRPTARPEDFIFDSTDFEPVGIITIEDVLEELLQVEILDETDKFVDNMQSTPVTTALIMRNLPPHLRSVLGTRSLLPRIGGAAFMDGGGGIGASHGHGLAASAGGAAGAGSGAGGVRLPPKVPSSGSGKAQQEQQQQQAAANGGLLASPTADGAAAAAAAQQQQHGGSQKSPRRGGQALPPRSPQQLSPRLLSPRPLSPERPESGAVTPTRGGAGGSTHGGLAYKQGSVGAALVAEALRQEIAAQLAAGRDGGGPVLTAEVRRPRSRSRSPLPGRVDANGGSARHTQSSPEGLALPLAARPSPFGSFEPTAPVASAAAAAAGAAAPSAAAAPAAAPAASPSAAAGAQPPAGGTGVRPTVDNQLPLFPGLRRSRSDATNRSTGGSSGLATPRMGVQLPPPPPRRSTNVSQRVKDQMDLLQPLITGSRRNSIDLSPRTSADMLPPGRGSSTGDGAGTSDGKP